MGSWGSVKLKSGPCKDCPDRVVGCHSTCERYLSFMKEQKEMYSQRRKDREIDEALLKYNPNKQLSIKEVRRRSRHGHE